MKKNSDIIKNVKKENKERSIDNAIQLANSLIKKLNINTYPVPIVSILNELGFNIYTSKMPSNISGFIAIAPNLEENFGNDKIIAVSNEDNIGRQRFTLAHEFAHYLFDFNDKKECQYVDTYDTEKSDEESESIPSRFAAEFLMPQKMFCDRYKELKSTGLSIFDLVCQLSLDFNVSRKAVMKRFTEIPELDDDI